MEDEYEYTAATKRLFSGLIKKPKMQDKYLRKPPFRFIHDIITNTMKETGFPVGIFTDTQLKAKLIKDKQSKLDFLEKLIFCIETATNDKLDVSPSKVVCGLEAEETNKMLQQFAVIAIRVSKQELQMEQILRQMNDPNSKQTGAEEAAAAAAAQSTEEKTPEDRNSNHNGLQSNIENQTPNALAFDSTATAKNEALPEPQILANDETETQKPATKQRSRPPSGKAQKLSNESDAPEWVISTQQTLGKLIQRPRLLAKLLKRPPFRFLHDIVKALIKATEYPSAFLDLSTDIENANVKDGNFKTHFLSKLILIVSATMTEDLSFIKPKDIIAGSLPENTNYLLTKLALAASMKIDEAVVRQAMVDIELQKQKANEKDEEMLRQKAEENERKRVEEQEAIEEARVQQQRQQQQAQAQAQEQKQNEKLERQRKRKASAKKPVMPKLELNAIQQMNQQPFPNMDAQQQQQQQQQLQQQMQAPSAAANAVQKLARPRTARRAPPKMKSNIVSDDNEQALLTTGSNRNSNSNTHNSNSSTAVQPPANVLIMDTDNGDENDANKESGDAQHNNSLSARENQRELAEFGFKDMQGTAAAENGRNFMSNMADEQMPAIADGKSAQSHGKLVRDILDAQSGIKLDTKLGAHRRDSSAKTTEKIGDMREMIQKLCQTCLPLGKCIDMAPENIANMDRELIQWQQQIEENKSKLTVERSKTKLRVQPLNEELKLIEKQIEMERNRILAKKAVLFKNERKIQEIIQNKFLYTPSSMRQTKAF